MDGDFFRERTSYTLKNTNNKSTTNLKTQTKLREMQTSSVDFFDWLVSIFNFEIFQAVV